MGDLPQTLATKWKVKHQEKSEEAFNREAVEGKTRVSTPSFFQVAEVALSGSQK
jgi:hypothetical protein